jgi:hypothetical protein
MKRLSNMLYENEASREDNSKMIKKKNYEENAARKK